MMNFELESGRLGNSQWSIANSQWLMANGQWPTNEPTHQPTNQPTNQLSNQPTNNPSTHTVPVALFDSGLGGLTILQAVAAELPQVPLVYFADQAHVPYGGRPAAEVQALSSAAVQLLLPHQPRLIVVACNTATASAIDYLRHTFPEMPFVGVEPAVKPAVQATRSGRIGVMATAVTLDSPRYASLKSRFGVGCHFYEDPCVGLVMRIERGEIATAETHNLLENIVRPWLDQGVDTLVLGCTHYPLVRPLLQQICGPKVTLIDSGPAVARQAAKIFNRQWLMAHGQLPTNQPTPPLTLLSNTDPAALQQFAKDVLTIGD